MAGGLLTGQAPVEVFAEAGDDEQRVVDAHPQAEHDGDGGGEVGHGHGVGGQPHHHHAGGDTRQSHADGQAHGQHGAEGQDQDHDGEAQAEHLGLGRLELGEGLTAQLHLETGRLGRRHQVTDLATDVLHLLEALDRRVELDVGEAELAGERTLGRHLGRVVERAGDGEALDGAHLVDQLGDGRPGGRVVQAAVGHEHDGGPFAGRLAAEAPLDQVEPAGGFALEVAEARRVAGAHRGGDPAQHHDEGHPGEQHPAMAAVAPATEAAERGSGVGRLPARVLGVGAG